MIVILGASGKTGLAIIEQLAQSGVAGAGVRGMVRRQAQVATVESSGAAEAIIGDLRNPADLRLAMQGAEAVYHICPNMQPDEVAIGQSVIEAAKEAGVARIVYHSVLHPQTQAMQHHWNKLLVEEMLFKSAIPFTVLQPAAYMQNVLAGWSDVLEQGRYRVPYHPDTVLGMVDLADVAEVAAKVLTTPDHDGAIYELATDERLTQHQAAQAMADVTGRAVEAVAINRAEWRAGAIRAGLSPYAIDTLLAMFIYYERYGFFGNGTVLRGLLGREPTTFEAFLHRTQTPTQPSPEWR